MLEDKTLENLLDLNGVTFLIDERLGLWVKFEAKKVMVSKERPYGVKYSLTLHDAYNSRIMGFDNSHSVVNGRTVNESAYDHFHRNSSDKAQPYCYESAAKLLSDFWYKVDKILERLKNV